MIVKRQLQETVHSPLLFGCFNFSTCGILICLLRLLLVLSCLLCNCCWLTVCIIVIVLCVLLSSYVYLLYYVCIAVF